MSNTEQYRKFAAECRELAAKLRDPNDRKAIELMAQAWDKIAADREQAVGKKE